MKLRILRRSATVVAGATAVVLISATAALAFPSGGNPGSTGPNHIEWTGNGSDAVSPSGTGACSASQEPNGQPANTPYLYWVLTTDGGSVNTTDSTNNQPLPYIVLTDHGNPQPQVPFDSSSSSNSVKFITSYFTPNLSTLQASAFFNVLTTGNGGWNLVISHGCAPPVAATPPTVQKNAAGAYDTTWTWGVSKSVDQNHINAPPGAGNKVNYTVVVTGTPTNKHIVVTGTIDIKNPNGVAIPTYNAVDQLSPNLGPCSFSAPSQLAPGDNNIPYTCNLPDNSNMNGVTNTITVTWPQQTLSDGSQLAASGSNPATFTTPPIAFTQGTVTDKCVTVTDTVAGALGQVCSGDLDSNGTKTLTYSHTFNDANNPDPAGTCTNHPNVVTITASDSGATSSDNANVEICTGAPLTVSKTATPSLTRTYHWNIVKTVDHSVIDTANSAMFNYNVAVTHDAGTDSNWQVTGTVTVTNPNDWESITLASSNGLTDAIDNGGVCTFDHGDPSGTVIPKNDGSGNNSVSFTYTCTYSSVPSPSNFTNTATASWDANAASTADGSANGTATGDFANANVTVVNSKVNVTDDNAPPGSGLPTTLDATTAPATTNFPYSITYNDPAGTCTSHTNTATFTATDDSSVTNSSQQTVQVCVGADLTAQKTATPSFIRTYTWGITKAVDTPAIDNSGPATFNYTVNVTHDAGADSGWKVTGDVTVYNPNDWEAIPLTGAFDFLSDNNATCSFDNGNPAGTIVPMATNGNPGSVDLPYTCTFSQAPSSASGTNFVTVNWDPAAAFTPDGAANASAGYDFTGVAPSKIVDGSVSVTDTLGGTLGTVSYTDPSPTSFTYPFTFSNDPAGTCTSHQNTATFITSDTGTTNSASQSVLHCIGADLTVAKTATPSFDRTYLWSINKAADKTNLLDGGKVTYTVTVNQTGVQDGNWQVAGTITVSNPNDWEGITLTGLTDAVNNGGTCTVGGSPAGTVIAPRGSAQFPYTCTYSSQPSNANGHNTAHATWDPTAASTPDGSADGGADFAFTNPAHRFNQTIHVTDPQAPSNPLGSLTGTDQAPFASGVFHYSKTFAAPTSGCVTINNTATITETGQNSNTVTVQNCTLGALTIGFWHNQNGQGIIGGANQAALQSYLKGFLPGPFQDAPSSNIAGYFLTIFNNANAGGATANAQLKAQMLATALDVYFSDPALGGNKINAPNPIGGVTVNISAWSAAFGGNTSMTVTQMLNFAASKSNGTGSTWYSNVKATQVLAIAAFNAVNNSTVTGP